jgi:peptidoglycan/xylan/chitin deacetylase (PgdA/CDA1 family)
MSGAARAKVALRRGLAAFLYWTGLMQLWQRIVLRRTAIVLMYHRVLTDEQRRRSASHPALIVSSKTFAMQMALLKRRFAVLTAAQLADHLERREPLPDSSVVITFDDGWHDNVVNAAPVLAAHQLPALIFLPMNYIGTRRMFWQEALTHVLTQVVREVSRRPARRTALAPLLTRLDLEWVLDVREDACPSVIIERIGEQKRVDRALVTALVDDLARELGLALEPFAETDGFMSWADVATLQRQGITFGGHGAEHRLLTYVSPEEVRSELRESFAAVTGRLAEPVPTFSYPNGYVNDAIVDETGRTGYRLAFITQRGPVTHDAAPLTIKRLNVHEAMTDTAPMFLARIVGLW